MCYSAQNCHTREARPKEQTKTPTKVHQLQNRQNTITQISPENGKPFWGQMDPIETITASIRPDKLRVLKYPSPKLFTLRFRPTIGCFTYVLDGFLRSGTKINILGRMSDQTTIACGNLCRQMPKAEVMSCLKVNKS